MVICCSSLCIGGCERLNLLYRVSLLMIVLGVSFMFRICWCSVLFSIVLWLKGVLVLFELMLGWVFMEVFLFVMGFVYSLYNDYRVLLDNMFIGFWGVFVLFVCVVFVDVVVCGRGSFLRVYLSIFFWCVREVLSYMVCVYDGVFGVFVVMVGVVVCWLGIRRIRGMN